MELLFQNINGNLQDAHAPLAQPNSFPSSSPQSFDIHAQNGIHMETINRDKRNESASQYYPRPGRAFKDFENRNAETLSANSLVV